jgi:hypothetical protein
MASHRNSKVAQSFRMVSAISELSAILIATKIQSIDLAYFIGACTFLDPDFGSLNKVRILSLDLLEVSHTQEAIEFLRLY